MEIIFLILYTLEMNIKIFALGFISTSCAYLRDYWNILDFIIIVSGYIPFIFGSSSMNLSVLRALRVLRPLRTISSIDQLRRILSALFAALPLLKDTLIIFIFFFMILAIAGL